MQEVCLRALAKPRLVRGADDSPTSSASSATCSSTTTSRAPAAARPRSSPRRSPTCLTAAATTPSSASLARDVHRAIAELPCHYRDVVVAVDVLGLPYADAADALDVPVGTS